MIVAKASFLYVNEALYILHKSVLLLDQTTVKLVFFLRNTEDLLFTSLGL